MTQLLDEAFDDDSWRTRAHDVWYSDQISLVGDPSDPSNRALRFRMPRGGHWGGHVEHRLGHERAYARFRVYIPEDFHVSDGGGKFAGGFVGMYGDQDGRGGTPSDGSGSWSARMRFEPADRSNEGTDAPIAVSYYTYHADMSGSYGDSLMWDDGPSGQFVLERGTWHTIEHYLNLGTPGENDAHLRAWVDDELVFEADSLRFRNAGLSDHLITDHWLSHYYGGGWTSPRDNDVYIDELVLHDENAHARTDDGSEPTAPDTDPDPDPDDGTDTGDTDQDPDMPQDYDVITVDAGEKYSHTVTEGETWENVLIDVTADGAGYELGIRAGSGRAVMRNIGVKGVNEQSHANGINPAATHPDGEVVIEHVYIGDGGDDATRHPGVWVHGTDHEGTAIFRECNVGWWTDNGLYGSGPAAQQGAENGGDSIIEASYAENNNISGFRIGTNNSVIRDSTVVVDQTPRDAGTGTNGRGIWMRGHTDKTLAERVDVVQEEGFYAVAGRYSDDSPLLRDSRVNGSISGHVRQQNVEHGTASKEPPIGCPTTPEEAAAGTSSATGTPGVGDSPLGNGSGDGSDGTDGDDQDQDQDQDDSSGKPFPTEARTRALTIAAGEETAVGEGSYVFEVTPYTDQAEGVPAIQKTGRPGPGADREDEVQAVPDADDGTMRARGSAALGGTDTFAVTGYITTFECPSEFTLTLDGEDVAHSAIVEGVPEPDPEPEPDDGSDDGSDTTDDAARTRARQRAMARLRVLLARLRG